MSIKDHARLLILVKLAPMLSDFNMELQVIEMYI